MFFMKNTDTPEDLIKKNPVVDGPVESASPKKKNSMFFMKNIDTPEDLIKKNTVVYGPGESASPIAFHKSHHPIVQERIEMITPSKVNRRDAPPAKSVIIV